MEKRKPTNTRPSPLPADYLRMVTEVFSANFDEGLKKIAKLTGNDAHFEASGSVFPSEVVVCVTLIHGDSLSATTIYASSDFDPKASSPTIQDLLALCIDAVGSVFHPLLNPKKSEALEDLVAATLSTLEDVPFDWTPVDVDKRRIFVKIDKANPKLERMADEWLAKNDPEHQAREELERGETEKLFVTGPTGGKSASKKPGSGSVH